MITCNSFSQQIDCVLTYTNEYNIKLIVLTLLFFYSLFMLWYSKNIDVEKSYMHFWGFWFSKVISIIYIIFSPLFYLLLLTYNLSLELFILFIVGFYLLATAVFIGVSIYSGTGQIWKLFGYDDWNSFKDNYRERKSIKKYG